MDNTQNFWITHYFFIPSTQNIICVLNEKNYVFSVKNDVLEPELQAIEVKFVLNFIKIFLKQFKSRKYQERGVSKQRYFYNLQLKAPSSPILYSRAPPQSCLYNVSNEIKRPTAVYLLGHSPKT